MPWSRRFLVLIVPLLLAPALAGCTLPENPFRSLKDPVSRTTFQDAGSNNTTWVLRLAGHFYLPDGTRFHLENENETCATTGLIEIENGSELTCRTKRDLPLYRLRFDDMDGDGRLSREDRFAVRPADLGPQILNGTYHLTLGLHEELPLFLLQQRFDAGPSGPLAVELLA